jgi:AraC family transcriptional regulator
MTPRIETLKEKKLVGKRLAMTLTQNRTGELWKSFMPIRNQVSNKVTNDFISLQIYDDAYFSNFNPDTPFEKWALVEVHDFASVHSDLEQFILPGGLYAVFDYTGPSNDPSIFQYIFFGWLPKSPYKLAQRPHFEVLGEKYKNNDPSSQEEIWIPIEEK